MGVNTMMLEEVFAFDGMNAFVNKPKVIKLLKEHGLVKNGNKSYTTKEVWEDVNGYQVIIMVTTDNNLIIYH